jgi:hypothetical protein
MNLGGSMDIENSSQAEPGRVRTVHPLADAERFGKFYDPDFSVSVKEESNKESAARWDKSKWNPAHLKDPNYNVKSMKVAEQSVVDLVTAWSNFTKGGVPIECTDENKPLLVTTLIPVDDDFRSLWQLTNESIAEQKKEEAKN